MSSLRRRSGIELALAAGGALLVIGLAVLVSADLTDSFRADLNPDGVRFHRIANGKPPVMPAFKSQLTPEEIWTVVAYAKSLRKP